MAGAQRLHDSNSGVASRHDWPYSVCLCMGNGYRVCAGRCWELFQKAGMAKEGKEVVSVRIEGNERVAVNMLNIGFGNTVNANRIIAIVSPESAPIKRILQKAQDNGVLIDATYGRRTRAVIIMDSDHVVLSAIHPETVTARANS